MRVQRESGGFVTADNVKTNDLIVIQDEGAEKEKEFEGGKKVIKLELPVKLPNGDEKTISLNGTSKNNMIEYYGEDTKDWVGKSARVEVLSQMVGKNRKKVIYLTPPGVDLEGEPIAQG